MVHISSRSVIIKICCLDPNIILLLLSLSTRTITTLMRFCVCLKERGQTHTIEGSVSRSLPRDGWMDSSICLIIISLLERKACCNEDSYYCNAFISKQLSSCCCAKPNVGMTVCLSDTSFATPLRRWHLSCKPAHNAVRYAEDFTQAILPRNPVEHFFFYVFENIVIKLKKIKVIF